MLGPGSRSVVWFYGCSRNCPGCIAREMSGQGLVDDMTAEDLYKWVESNHGIEGVTLSGGEPFEQDPDSLLVFLQKVKNDSRNLSVIAFTGYLLAELQDDPLKAPLLRYVDVLVDGPYVQELNTGMGLRGSSNQKIHFLTDRYVHLQEELINGRRSKLEIDLTQDGVIQVSGIPHRNFILDFEKRLKESGLCFNFKESSLHTEND